MNKQLQFTQRFTAYNIVATLGEDFLHKIDFSENPGSPDYILRAFCHYLRSQFSVAADADYTDAEGRSFLTAIYPEGLVDIGILHVTKPDTSCVKIAFHEYGQSTVTRLLKI